MIKQLLNALAKLLTWWVVIAPWERGVRLRWGKHATELQPGLRLKVPLMHQVYRQSTRLLIVDAPNQTLTTTDGKVLYISVVVGFAIDDILKLYQTIVNPRETVVGLVMGAVASVVAATHSSLCTPALVEQKAAANLAEMGWGLAFAYTRVTDFAFVRTYRFITDDSSTRFWSGDIRTSEPVSSYGID